MLGPTVSDAVLLGVALGAAAARFLDDLIAGRRSEPRPEVLPT